MLRRRINSKVTVNKHKIGEKSFTRNTKMNFTNITFFIMNMVSKTMQREINNFIKNVKDSSIKYTQSAMSKARLKISPELFRELNEGLINDIYEDKEDIKLYMGFRIFGIDGTRFELPNMIIPKDKKQSEDIKKIYGQATNQHGSYAVMPRGSIMYDVENKFVIDGILNSLHVSERFMAIEHIEHFLKHKKSIKEQYNDLLIYDRGYPSFGLISYHYKNNLDFIMRVNSKSFKAVQEFKRSKKMSEIIEIEATKAILVNLSKEKQHHKLKQISEEFKEGDKIKIRAVKVLLENGDIEVLLTSLLSEEIYETSIFKELYFKRWGVETAYNVLKNIFNIENFTGLTQIAINQDFFATILTNNICSLIMNDVMEEKVTLYNNQRNRKYFYQLNNNFSIGCMKDKLVLMLTKNARIEKIYEMIEDEILSKLLPIKPNRSFPRKKNSSAKFPISKKYNGLKI
jgi:hypothetical protein